MKKFFDLLHHLFIPKEQNNYRAKVLHIDFLTYYLLFAIILTFSFKNLNKSFNNILGYATDITIDKLYQLTNEERAKNNLQTLNYNEKLANAAYKKAQDMFAKNYWSHYSPDGATPWDFILSANYQYEYAGENLAKNFLFSQGVVEAWMNSKTHRDNILKSEYSDVGYAIVNGILNGEETTLVVQMFAKPLNNPIAKQVAAAAVEKPIVQPTPPTLTNSIEQPKPAIVAKNTSSNLFNSLNLSFDINYIFLLFLLIALIADFYFANHFHIIRINGKNLAHFIFVGFILFGLLFLTKGAIL